MIVRTCVRFLWGVKLMAKRTFRMAGALATATLLTLGLSAEAGAAEGPDVLQQQIDQVLARTEGGVQISRYEIAWNGGEAVMAFPLPGERYAPPSSAAAVKLQAETVGLSSAETAKAVSAATEELDGTPAPEAVPSDEEEPAGEVTAAASNCPTETLGNDWYCFYQYKSYAGKRLAWNAAHKNYMYFSAYNFVNRTSSWANKGGKTIYVRGRTQSGNDGSCNQYSNNGWNEPAHTTSTGLSSSLDNTADCFWTS
ncbi:hypothetical protein [Streptomyces sp. NPDC050988]|uniref:hypothetical protein n=1 Tax=Streptomyces sp. NPDC050988 TaxID=3365637 RepID=UPI0037B59240